MSCFADNRLRSRQHSVGSESKLVTIDCPILRELIQLDDIFKDQTSKFGQLPHKKVSREELLEETREQVSYFTGIDKRLFVVSFAILLVFTVTAIGGIMFVKIENGIESDYQPFSECFRIARESRNLSVEIVNLLESCIKR